MAEQIQDAREAGPGADAANARGTPEPSPPTPAPPAEAVPAVSHSVKDASLADRLADWGLPSVLKGIHHELDTIGRIHKYDWISKRLMVLRNMIIASLLVLATILIVVIAWRGLAKSSLVINGFDVPTTLEERGYSSRVLGKKLVDQMTLIRSQTLTKLSTRSIVPSVWSTGADLAIADSKLTVGTVFAYVRGLRRRDTYVDGELTGEPALNDPTPHISVGKRLANKAVALSARTEAIAAKYSARGVGLSPRFYSHGSRYSQCSSIG